MLFIINLSANKIGLDLLYISVCISQLYKEGRPKDLELNPILNLGPMWW